MIHHSTAEAIEDLARLHDNRQLRIVDEEVDPNLLLPAITRRLYEKQGPAVLFQRIKGNPFPAVVNLYGTMDRARYLFRHTYELVSTLIKAKGHPLSILQEPSQWWKLPSAGLNALPRKVKRGPIDFAETTLDKLPQIVSWPMDGGAFITLPQVCTLDPYKPSIYHSNLGMYRVQISGNQYEPNECGLHYQIHRGIGIHHQKALQIGKPLKVSIFVGGPPAHALAAVMPLPENIPELVFAGVLAGTPFRYSLREGWVVSSEADFVILGEVLPQTKPEGPFGDHLGYYSLQHEFPCLQVHKVLHRKNAIWNMTVVGRPPQEDTTFGQLIHEMTGPAVPATLPGIHEVHAVDAAGVHPLLLAIGSERYVPYQERRPMELWTQANALLGFGQISLAKYVFLTAKEDAPNLHTHDIAAFFEFILARIHFSRDLHFQTATTIDTLDYSSSQLNQGSKLIIAACGKAIRSLGNSLEGADGFADFALPHSVRKVCVVMPGVLAMEITPEASITELEQALAHWPARDHWPWISLVDDCDFCAQSLSNWLWVTFTRSNPSHDVYGVHAKMEHKHWSCEAPLLVDARKKTHHAPELQEPQELAQQADQWFAKGRPFEGV